MHISRIQIEEGFLDGLDIQLVPGLNVVIGARGTGKTSLIELIRFCLDVKGFNSDSTKRSHDHALSVLGSGQVTVTLTDGARQVTISRTSSDRAPRTSGPFVPPIVFSQTEIETVGLQPNGRLALLDSFTGDRRRTDAEESDAISEVRSSTLEVESIRREIDELAHQLAEIPAIDEQIGQLAPAEQQLAKLSSDAASKKQQLDQLSTSIATKAVASATIDRFSNSVSRSTSSIVAAINSVPGEEVWPSTAGEDLLKKIRDRVNVARTYLKKALDELVTAENEAKALSVNVNQGKIGVEEQARQLRKEIEAVQSGAGSVARQGQQLRERKAQLESLRQVAAEKTRKLAAVVTQRSEALDKLDTIRDARFKLRADAALHLNKVLGPKIRIVAGRAGQFDAYSFAIADVLRGSGLRYGDLAPALAARVSPRELLEAADSNDFASLSDATGVSKDRAVRILSHLKTSDLGTLATVSVDDVVSFELLDGLDYKDISDLSTGQRCTVVLPLVLRHTERILIVDQPEDHIDNAFIADTLIRSILARDPNGQIVFSTHNANIPVLGNADRVVQLGSDGKRGFALLAAELNAPAAINAITTVMEGGVEAFGRRASFYGRHKAK
jgi:recombinational DNA repair ATPase RecF